MQKLVSLVVFSPVTVAVDSCCCSASSPASSRRVVSTRTDAATDGAKKPITSHRCTHFLLLNTDISLVVIEDNLLYAGTSCVIVEDIPLDTGTSWVIIEHYPLDIVPG